MHCHYVRRDRIVHLDARLQHKRCLLFHGPTPRPNHQTSHRHNHVMTRVSDTRLSEPQNSQETLATSACNRVTLLLYLITYNFGSVCELWYQFILLSRLFSSQRINDARFLPLFRGQWDTYSLGACMENVSI